MLFKSVIHPLQILSLFQCCISAKATSHLNLVRQRDSSVRLDRRHTSAVADLTQDDGFWFANFNIGDSRNLSLLIDTGSSDIIINPGHYQKSSAGQELHNSFNNSYGTTNSDGSGSGSVSGPLYRDAVTYAGLTIIQTIGIVDQSLVPHDGLAGFAGTEVAQFPANASSLPFFHALCQRASLPECRFGLVLGKETGTQVLGALDTSLFDGDLTTVNIIQEWAAYGDLAVNGQIIAKDLPIELDSGTATIVGPIDQVLTLFKMTNITSVTTISPTTGETTITGYFPCDQPPAAGFSFPSQSDIKKSKSNNSSRIFNLSSESWIFADNGNNNCTAVVSGYDYAAVPGLWVVGQPFFQGLYIDHNVDAGTVGLAYQKSNNKTTVNSSHSVPENRAAVLPGGNTWLCFGLVSSIITSALL